MLVWFRSIQLVYHHADGTDRCSPGRCAAPMTTLGPSSLTHKQSSLCSCMHASTVTVGQTWAHTEKDKTDVHTHNICIISIHIFWILVVELTQLMVTPYVFLNKHSSHYCVYFCTFSFLDIIRGSSVQGFLITVAKVWRALSRGGSEEAFWTPATDK